MSNAKAVVEQVIYDALADGIEGATVYQDVPEDAPLPLVIVGDMKSYPLGAKDDPDRCGSVIVVSVVAAEEPAPLLALQKQIEDLLDGKTFSPEGWIVQVSFEDDDAILGQDGATYVGTTAVTAIALTA